MFHQWQSWHKIQTLNETEDFYEIDVVVPGVITFFFSLKFTHFYIIFSNRKCFGSDELVYSLIKTRLLK